MKKSYQLVLVFSIMLLSVGCMLDPYAGFDYDPDYPKAGETVYFYEYCDNAKTFEWDFGDGSGSTSADPQHVYSTAGTYLVTLTIYSGRGESDYSSESIEIEP